MVGVMGALPWLPLAANTHVGTLSTRGRRGAAIRLIGLTGGIACGKSTVAGIFRQAGIPVVDADQIAREVVAPGTPGLAKIVEAFGDGVLLPDGQLDRRALGAQIFGDDDLRQTLNQIVHPAVAVASAQAFGALRESGELMAVYDVPLLYEVGRDAAMDVVVVVSATPDNQRARLLDRDADLTAAQADERICSQMPVSEKVVRADYAIHNDDSREALAVQAGQVIEKLKERFSG